MKLHYEIFRKSSGFTLTEVMATIFILCLLSSVGFYFVKNTIANANLTSFCEMLYSDILTSQGLAQVEGRNYLICLNEKSYAMLPENEDNLTVRKVPSYTTIEKTTFTKSDPGRNKIRFFRNTGTPSQGGTITVKSDTGKRKYIIVSYYIGRIRISDTPP